MNDQSLQPRNSSPFGSQGSYGSALAAQRQRVLRNTYWLLALSLIPTVLGAWIGVEFQLFRTMTSGLSTLVFFIGAFGLMFLVEKNKDSGKGVAFLLAFTFFMGLMLSRLVASVLGFQNGGTLIMTAFGGTAAIFLTMASLATVIKRDLSGLAKFLLVGAVILMIAMVANIFLQSSALMLTMLVAMLGIFSAFMLVDIKRVLDGGETNYISATLAIYLDLYNVFQALLSLLGLFGGDRR